jgi:hypothetical protein
MLVLAMQFSKAGSSDAHLEASHGPRKRELESSTGPVARRHAQESTGYPASSKQNSERPDAASSGGAGATSPGVGMDRSAE